jgi:hypothetical protein
MCAIVVPHRIAEQQGVAPMRLSILCLAGAIGAALAPMPSGLVERWYARGLYPRFQPALTAASSTVRFALLDVAVIVLLLALAWFAIARWRRSGLLAAARAVLWRLVVGASLAYLLFLACWGLNYRRVLLESRLAYDPSRVNAEAAVRFAREAVRQVNALAAGPRDEPADAAIEAAFARAQRVLGDRPLTAFPPPKQSMLTWYFRAAAIDGMTVPWFLEIIVNPEVRAFERPFTLAHEWAHVAGYAQESEANFLAWLACVGAADPAVRYSGWLMAYRRSAGAVDRGERRALRAALHPAVVADLQALDVRLSRASPAVREAAMGAYDRYLKANRVEEGIASYGAVLRLMLGTVFDDEWTPRLRDR